MYFAGGTQRGGTSSRYSQNQSGGVCTILNSFVHNMMLSRVIRPVAENYASKACSCDAICYSNVIHDFLEKVGR